MPETHHRSGSRTVALLVALLALTSTVTATAAPAEARRIKTARASYAQPIEPLAQVDQILSRKQAHFATASVASPSQW